ncbi:MAG: DUF2194 domain-containing protein, partial [Treponema sp.]|nr:DUF2194 domain-containing protein [Treponema sp.]
MADLRIRKKNYANQLWVIILPLVVFCVLGTFVAIERAGISLNKKAAAPGAAYLPQNLMVPRADRKPDVRCLLICNSLEKYNYPAAENIGFVLNQMSVGYTMVDISKTSTLPPLGSYKTMIIACTDLERIALSVQSIFNWVKAGGGLLFAQTPEYEVLTKYFYRELGIAPGQYVYVPQITAFLETDFLAGGKGATRLWSEASYKTDPTAIRYGVNFKLNRSSTVHMTSTGPSGPTAMLWVNRAERGRVVVNNNDTMGEKWSRGLVAAAYGMTEQAVAYPVINASVFFIDDFPSPVPGGTNEYIKKDYDVTTEYFYTHVWFPDMLRLAQKHKVKYTGLLIETYNDNVVPPFQPEPAANIDRIKYFGTLLLNEGFEIGLHGYNHQPLVLQNFDYKGELPYNKWSSPEFEAQALNETVRFNKNLFPGFEMKTYVPPSNVLSKEGRAMLKQYFPSINVISGLLVSEIFHLDDDFGVADDGFINIPRVSEGYDPLNTEDNHTFWIILNELNLHFIVSHFIHPDDMMDPERGALKGWAALSKGYDDFLTWVNKFPLRPMTAQEAASAVQRFDNLTVKTTLAKNEMNLDLGGFYDEAWLLVRINDGSPLKTTGGTLTKVSENLYLLKA